MNKASNKTEKIKTINFVCSCGCKAQAAIQEVDSDCLMIDTRKDGRGRWAGVALRKNDIKRLYKFFNKGNL